MLNWVKEKFNLTQKQATYTVVSYKVTELCLFTGLWIACYRYNPTRIVRTSPYLRTKMTYYKEQYPNTVQKFNQNISKMKNWIDKNEYAKSFSFHLGVKHGNLSRSFIETIIINKLSFPVLIPVKLAISLSVAKALARDDDQTESENLKPIEELFDDLE